MALLLRNGTIFFHLGRAGGYGVRSTLQALGVADREVGAFHCSPAELPEESQRRSFTFVRHPLAWLRSLWYHKLAFGLDEGDHPLLHQIHDVSPKTFLEFCIENFPNGIAYDYAQFFLRATYVCRSEDVETELKKVLVLCGEVSADDEFSIVRENCSNHRVISEFQAPRGHLEAYLKTEKHWCGLYGYSTVPKHMIGKGEYISPLRDGWSNRLYRSGREEGAGADQDGSCLAYSPYLLGCAVRSGVDLRNTIAHRVYEYDYDDFLCLSEALRERHRFALRAFENFVVSQSLRDIGLAGKRVLQVGCGNGFHALSAERLGAEEVVAIDCDHQPFLAEFLIPFLASRVRFMRLGFDDIPSDWNRSFDVVVISKFHKLVDAPHPALRKLLGLLRPDGCMILGLDVVDSFPEIPLVFHPRHEFSPTGGRCYLNPRSLSEALSGAGAVATECDVSLKIGLDEPRRFPELPFPDQDTSIVYRTSVVNKEFHTVRVA